MNNGWKTMLNDNQIKQLEAKLNPDVVKKRPDSGMSYVEGWHAIAEANRIFGFGNWTRETVELTENTPPTKNQNSKNVVSFRAKVRVTACGVIREGTGFGSGIAGDIHAAYEGAIKEAETDAMKRALMTFGNPFGLALYDKTQANVGTDEPTKPTPEQLYEKIDVCHLLSLADTEEDLQSIMDEFGQAIGDLPEELQAEITEHLDAQINLRKAGAKPQIVVYSFAGVGHAVGFAKQASEKINSAQDSKALGEWVIRWDMKLKALDTALKADKYQTPEGSPYTRIIKLYTKRASDLSQKPLAAE